MTSPREALAGDAGGTRFERVLRRAPAGQILRFAIVGITATLVHLGLLRLGVEWLGVPPVPANALAFSVAVAVTYLGQSLWVFRGSGHSLARLPKFLVSVFAGLFANIGIMALAVHVFGLNYLVGFAAALVIVPIMTFLVNKFWVFSRGSA